MQSRRAPSSIGYLPILRKGDLLFNLVILRHALTGARAWSQCAIDVFGLPWNRSRHLFGCNAHWVATHVFANGLSARDVLAFHTLFGIYRHAASNATISRYVAKQVDSSRRTAFNGDGLCHPAARYLRSCRQCIEGDYASRGFPTWRVIHQIATLDRCPEHGDALVNEWPPAGDMRNRTWPFFLPGESTCRHPLTPADAMPTSDGYAAYLKLWSRLVRDDLAVVQPARWFAFVQRLVSRFGDRDEAASVLEEAMLHNWGLPALAIGRLLHLAGGPSFVLQELMLRTRPRNLARRLVVYAAAQSLGIDEEPAAQLPLTLPLRTDPAFKYEAHGWAALWSVVTDHGMPLVLASALRDDGTVRNIAHRTGTDPGRLGAFIARFPNELLFALRQLQPWSEDSWLARELERRRRQASSSPESRPEECESLGDI